MGPKWNHGKPSEDNRLKECYRNSLQQTEDNNLVSIAFPNISTGIYGFPKKRASEIVFEVMRNYPFQIIEKVIFVCYDIEDYEYYLELLNE